MPPTQLTQRDRPLPQFQPPEQALPPAATASSTQRQIWGQRPTPGNRTMYPQMGTARPQGGSPAYGGGPSTASPYGQPPRPQARPQGGPGYQGGYQSVAGPPQPQYQTQPYQPTFRPQPQGQGGFQTVAPQKALPSQRPPGPVVDNVWGGPQGPGGGLNAPHTGGGTAQGGGGDLNGLPVQPPRRRINRVNDSMRGPVEVALQRFQQHAQESLGRSLTEAEIQGIAGQLGAFEGGQITGRQFNQALDLLEGMSPEGWEGEAPPEVPTIGGGYQPTPGYTDPPIEFEDSPQAEGYRPPPQGEFDARSQAILRALQENPDLYGADTIAQLKASGRSGAMDRADALKGAANADTGRRGFTGGQRDRATSAIESNLINDLLNSDRDVDLNAVSANRQSRMDVLGAGEQFTSGRSARSLNEYGGYLQGQGFNQQAREGDREARLAAAQFNQGVRSEDRAGQLREFLAQHGVNMDRMNFGEAQRQFKISTGLDLMRFLEAQRQFNVGTAEGSRQFNVNAGLNTASLQMQNQQAMMNYLRQMGLL